MNESPPHSAFPSQNPYTRFGLSDDSHVRFVQLLQRWKLFAHPTGADGFFEDINKFCSAQGLDEEFRQVAFEVMSDETELPELKVKALTAAIDYARLFASWATSGGEGAARMEEVHRLEKKLKELKQ